MAIKSIDKMWSRSSSNAALEDNFRKITASFTEAYQVLHDPNEPKINIYQANGIPRAGQPFPSFPFCYADTASIESVSPTYSIVTIVYNGEIANNEYEPSPLFAPPKIDWDDTETEEEIDQDINGNAIMTANHEPIIGIKRPIPDQTLTIRRNMAFFSPALQSQYRQAVNSDLFMGWPPGSARMTKFAASNVYDQNIGYWEVTGQFQFRFPYRTTFYKAWWKRVRHQGFYIRAQTPAGIKIVRAVDEALREPVTQPVQLDRDGYPLTGGAAYWLEFQIFNYLPFNALGLI